MYYPLLWFGLMGIGPHEALAVVSFIMAIVIRIRSVVESICQRSLGFCCYRVFGE